MSLRLTKRLSTAPGVDAAGDALQSAARAAVGAAPLPLRNLLDGTWLGAPLHPALTDVPIGAWTAALLLDCVRADEAADGALAVGIAGAVPAALTGANDWSHLRGDAKRVGTLHALLNVAGLGLQCASLGLRKAGRRDAGRIVSGAGFLASAAAAHLGGQLSFGLGVRVNRTAWEAGPEEFRAVLDEDELTGELKAVDLDGTTVLVTRSEGGRPCAIAATCTHLGGPLAEGERDGDTVICPWHGSRFELCTGNVLDGPAVFPQPRYEARLRDGKVELRAAGS